MRRNFPDFLDAYFSFAKDNFVPDKFHYWTGISTIAGALERKVWTVNDKSITFPNLYIGLISRPGIGKSTAGNLGIDAFLRNLGEGDNVIGFLGTQNSEAGLEQTMTKYKKFTYRGEEYTHSSYFLFASEGANSLKEIKGGGDIGAILTDFYDCKAHFTKHLSTRKIEIYNGCLNILACFTFDALERLLGGAAIEGGFASRLICVSQNESFIRRPVWNAGTERDPSIRTKLLEDLSAIYNLNGMFTPTDEFADYWAEWFPKQDGDRQSLKSERLQNFMVRKSSHTLKLAMICSVSEGNSLVLDLKHWKRAEKILDEVERNTPGMAARSVNKLSPKGVVYTLMKVIQECGGFLEHGELMNELLQQGVDTARLPAVISQLISSRSLTKVTQGGDSGYKLLANPDDYL